MTDTFTPARPYLNTLTDGHGRTWQIAYWGTGFVYIRQLMDDDHSPIRIGDHASRDDWPYVIDLNGYSMTIDNVTTVWLTERASSWVDDRSNEDRDLTP